MRISVCILFCAFFLSAISEAEEKWIAYYDDKLDFSNFTGYDLIVFDPDYHPDFRGIPQRGKIILGYVSLGEAEKERRFYGKIAEQGILLQENGNWPGAYFIDLRNPFWAKLLIEEIIPSILQERFNGIFLDTLDNAILLEQQDPDKYGGMKSAAANLIRAIRLNYPKIKIMLNRAYELIPEVGGLIDYELGESVLATYDFKKEKYKPVDEKEYLEQVNILREAKRQFPGLKIYTLDYADPKDLEMREKIYKAQIKNGFIPYVTTIDLHKITDREAR